MHAWLALSVVVFTAAACKEASTVAVPCDAANDRPDHSILTSLVFQKRV